MSKDKLKLDSIMPLDQVVGKLEELVASLKNGTVSFQLGQESLSLTPPSVVDFEMKVSKKKDREKVSIEISWDAEAVAKALKISNTDQGMQIA